MSSELSAIIAGLIGGGKYGIRIRLPHSAVMTMLFRQGSAKAKLKFIVKSTLEHSRNLASFATIYKTILFLLKWLNNRLQHSHPLQREYMFANVGKTIAMVLGIGPHVKLASLPPGIPGQPQHAAIAGAIGGYIVWGRYSSINYQIVLYLTSRVISGMVSLAREKGVAPFNWKICSFDNVYPIKAALVWGAVMALFESYPHVLHPSLKKSMDEVYRYEIENDRQ